MSNIQNLVDRWDTDDRAPPGTIGNYNPLPCHYLPAFEIMKQIQKEDEDKRVLPKTYAFKIIE
jgi:hypothetical protein